MKIDWLGQRTHLPIFAAFQMTMRTPINAALIHERLKAIRNWCFSLGLIACSLAVTATGATGIGNPKTWSSAYHAMAAAGMLGWFAIGTFCVGVGLVVAGSLAAAFIKRQNH
jgi:hypothetical protein